MSIVFYKTFYILIKLLFLLDKISEHFLILLSKLN